MNDLFSSPFFGIGLSLITYEIGHWIFQRTKFALANPLLISIALCILVLEVFRIPYESYTAGGAMISVFLGPATASIALSIYTQLSTLRRHFIPILMGALVGSVVSIISVYFLCELLGLNQGITRSLMVKSVSTPFALPLSTGIGGVPSISVIAVIITGIFGAVSAPLMIRMYRAHHPVVTGVAIGTSSHAVGTAKAMELGEVQGAMSGIALALSGILTVFILMAMGLFH